MKYGRKLTPDLLLQKHLHTQPPLSFLLKSGPFRLSALPQSSALPISIFRREDLLSSPNWWGFCTLKEVPLKEQQEREGAPVPWGREDLIQWAELAAQSSCN